MAWYECPACKKRFQRYKGELDYSGGYSICGKTGRRVRPRLVKPKRKADNG